MSLFLGPSGSPTVEDGGGCNGVRRVLQEQARGAEGQQQQHRPPAGARQRLHQRSQEVSHSY